MLTRRGARICVVTAPQSLNGTSLLGGPLRLRGWSLTDGIGSNDSNIEGSQTTPGAGTTIASVALANGLYSVQWSVELAGTPGAGDANNVAMFIGASQIDTSVNQGANGIYPQDTAEAVVTFGPLTLAAKAIGAATAGAVYTVRLTATPLAHSLCAIQDGKLQIAFADIPPQGAQTIHFSDEGIRIDNSLSVQTSQGTIQGVIYYDLLVPDGDLMDVGMREAV